MLTWVHVFNALFQVNQFLIFTTATVSIYTLVLMATDRYIGTVKMLTWLKMDFKQVPSLNIEFILYEIFTYTDKYIGIRLSRCWHDWYRFMYKQKQEVPTHLIKTLYWVYCEENPRAKRKATLNIFLFKISCCGLSCCFQVSQVIAIYVW